MDLIADLGPNSPVELKFNNGQNRTGWLALFCAKPETTNWLKSVISSIVPWKGASLKIVNECD